MTSRARKASVTRASGTIRGMKWVIGSALAAIPAGALAQADAPVETVGPGTTIGIAFFLAVAVLIVVSFLFKLLVFAGLVPSNKKSLCLILGSPTSRVRCASPRAATTAAAICGFKSSVL